MNIELPDLHDAVLVNIGFDWALGVASLKFRTSRHGEVLVHVMDCTELVVPRHEDWGRSVSVLAASNFDGDPSDGLVIDMQSGDRLVVRGRVGAWVEAG